MYNFFSSFKIEGHSKRILAWKVIYNVWLGAMTNMILLFLKYSLALFVYSKIWKSWTSPLMELWTLKAGYLLVLFIWSVLSFNLTISICLQHFEDLVAGHFLQQAHQILLSCKAYIDGALVGSNVNDRAGSQVPDASTRNFKISVIRMMNMLITSFTKNGSTDCEQYRLPG